MASLRHIFKWRPTRAEMAVLALFAVLIAVYVASEIKYAYEVKPKATTLNEFLQVMPVDSVWQSREASGTYTIVRCHPPNVPLAFPSGPPVYKFDAAGKLVEWTSGGG